MPSQARKILVIGGGSQLALRLVATLPHTRVVTRRGGVAQDEFVVADYGDIPEAAFADVDTVINCVGTASGDAAMLDRINVAIPVRAASAARVAGCRQFVQVSSLSVYGIATAIDRDTPIRPDSPYGRSKAAADAALTMLASDRFAIRIVRAPAIYGPGAAGKFGVLADFMRRAGWFPVPLALGRRSVLYRDNAAIVLQAIAASDIDSGIEFAADPGCFDIALLAAAVTRVSSFEVRLVRLPTAAFATLKGVAPQLHASLYASSVIDPAALTSPGPLAVTTIDGFVATLAARWKLA